MKIYNQLVSKEVLDTLTSEVSSGKYSQISLKKIMMEIKKELINNPSLIIKIEKKKVRQELVKKIKRKLHKGIGVFAELTLSSHPSSKNRDYSIYKKIFKITSIPNIIQDLGCGLNPLSYNKLDCNPKYYCCDINKNQVKIINEFFKNNKIDGKAEIKDLTNFTPKKADITFLFQVLDSIELTKSHKLSEMLIKKIKSQWIIVSFSSVTLTGKRMNYPERGWFERLLIRIKMKYQKIYTYNEIFYIIKNETCRIKKEIL